MTENWRESSWAEKFDYVIKNINSGDVTFSVGPSKEEVKAVQFLLIVSSPVFERMLSEEWRRTQEPIPLPHIQPETFRLFLQVLLDDMGNLI